MGTKKNKIAFTILEVIAALIILAVLVSSGTFLVPFYRLSNKTSQKLMAANFARETMERLYWDPNLATTAAPVVDPLLPGALNNASNVLRTYTVTDDATGNYRIIDVTVHWD